MRRVIVAFALLLSASCLLAADKYVSPSGSGTTCSLASPGSLATAVSGGCGAAPGDTIWARGGTYNGTYTINLQGSSSAPIKLRNYPGEQPTIDGGNSNGQIIVYLSGKYYWLWGFEVTSSNPDRTCSSGGPWCPGSDLPAGEGVTVIGNTGDHPGVKVINCIIHDTRQGISVWKEASNLEAYGNLVYYNGWNSTVDGRHGHGFYAQGYDTDTDVLRNNFVFNNSDHGIQVYGSDQAFLNNFQLYENAFVNNSDRQVLIGGGVTVKSPKLIDNTVYKQGTAFSIGYYGSNLGTSNAVVTGNHVGARGEMWPNSQSGMTMTGNTFVYSLGTSFSGNYPSNTYRNGSEPGTFARVVKNTYDPARCHVHIVNYPNTNTATADLTPCGFANGAAIQVRNARNYFAAPWQTGVFSSANPNFTFQMSGQTLAAPRGLPAYPVDATRIGLFVVIATGGAGPTATPAPSTPVPTVPAPTVTPTPPASAFTVNLPTSSAVIVSPVTYSAGIIASVTQDLGSATFAFSVPTAGTYRVWHYVWADNSSDDSWYVSMDGGAEDVDDVAEGQWTPGAWKWTTAAARAGGAPASVNPRLFTLSAGAHTLKFRGRENGSKIGNVYVTNDGGFVPPSSTPQPSPSFTVTPSATPSMTPTSTMTRTPTPTFTATGTPPVICLTATPTPTP